MGVRLRMTVLAAATFALVTACGGGGDGGNEVASLSEPAKAAEEQTGDGNDPAKDEEKMREFAKCMQEHGVDMPEPTSGPNGGMAIEMKDGDPETMKAADEACRHLLPNGGVPPKLDAAQLDELRKQAKCMREHGVNMPDPDPNNPMMKMDLNGVDEETVKKAFEACGNGKMAGQGEVSNGSGGPKVGIAVPGDGGGK